MDCFDFQTYELHGLEKSFQSLLLDRYVMHWYYSHSNAPGKSTVKLVEKIYRFGAASWAIFPFRNYQRCSDGLSAVYNAENDFYYWIQLFQPFDVLTLCVVWTCHASSRRVPYTYTVFPCEEKNMSMCPHISLLQKHSECKCPVWRRCYSLV